ELASDLQLRPQRAMQLQGHVRFLGRTLRRSFDRDFTETDLPGAPPDDLVVIRRLDAEIPASERIEVVPCRGAVQHVRLEHRIEAHALEHDAVMTEDVCIEL